MLQSIKSILTKFCGDREGATTVEFMVVMPLIVFWFAGTFTFFNAYGESTKALKATYTVADILSRQTEVDDTYINSMNMLFANFMGESTNDVWIRVSSIEKIDDDLTIDWSTATGLHNPLQIAGEIPAELIPTLVNGETVILIESFSPFVPFLDYIGIDARTNTNIIVISPRFTSQLANLDA